MVVRVLMAGCLALALSGCVSDGTGPTFSTLTQQLGTPKAGQSRIVLMREDGLIGAIMGWEVKLDGAPLSPLTPGTYAYADRPAGAHLLSASVFGYGDTNVNFSTAAGRTYFFVARLSDKSKAMAIGMGVGGAIGAAISMSANGGPYDFLPVPEAEARSMIAELKLAR